MAQSKHILYLCNSKNAADADGMSESVACIVAISFPHKLFLPHMCAFNNIECEFSIFDKDLFLDAVIEY